MRTVPTYTHDFYARAYQGQRMSARFQDLVAFRSFVTYQVRLVNAVISRVRGVGSNDPVAIARLNTRLQLEDLDELKLLFQEMTLHRLLSEEVGQQCLEHIDLMGAVIFFSECSKNPGNPRAD